MLVKQLNFLINLFDLKYRFFYFILSFFSTFIICFDYKLEIFYFFSSSFLRLQQEFIYTSLLDPLFVYLKVVMLATFFFIFPYYLYLSSVFFFKSWYGTYFKIYNIFIFFLFSVSFLLYYFFYFFFLDFFFNFILTFERISSTSLVQLYLEATITQYFSFFFNFIFIYFLITISLLFFIFFIFLGLIKEVTFFTFFFRRYIYAALFFLFLFVAPPDLLIQIVLLIPVFLFLEMYIYIVTFFFTLYTDICNFK